MSVIYTVNIRILKCNSIKDFDKFIVYQNFKI